MRRVQQPVRRLLAVLVLAVVLVATPHRAGAVTDNPKGYALQFYSTLFAAPANATVYYIGQLFSYPPDTTAAFTRIDIPRAGVIRAVDLTIISGSGTSEQSTVRLYLNGGDSSVISSTWVTNAASTITNNALSVPVTASDWVTVKWTTPTWVTNPTNIIAIFGVIYIDIP